MNLPSFDYLAPRGLEEALGLKAAWGGSACWLSGGSDLLVRAKQGLAKPEALISLKHLAGALSGVRGSQGRLAVGALTTLHDLAGDPLVRGALPGLVEALTSIGAPTLQQRVASLGGNLCSDTRCLYYNQSAFWRSGLAPCFKLGGEVCHPGGPTADRCRSVCQADAAVMLMALGARVTLARQGGSRELALMDFYTGQGEHPLAMEPEELLTEVSLPLPGRGSGSAYEKLRLRGAMDFPLLSAGVDLGLKDGRVAHAHLALGAVYAAPLLLHTAMEPLLGREPNQEALDDAARRAGSDAGVFLIENLGAPAAWRAEMVPVLVGRALTRALARARGGA